MKSLTVSTAVLATFLLSSSIALAQTQPRDEEQEASARHAEFKKKARTLVPAKDERAPYADFLKLPHTGLIRLLPREKYIHESYAEALGDGFDPVSNRGDARDGGAYYSFTRLTHAYGYGSDLSLEQNHFNVGFAGADYGFLTDLGDLPLEYITLDTPQVLSLVTYVPADNEPAARLEFRRFKEGADLVGVNVKSSLPMRVNSTYLLRTINYDQADLLIAFRVVEIDSDGTPLILWKRLKKFLTPELARNN